MAMATVFSTSRTCSSWPHNSKNHAFPSNSKHPQKTLFSFSLPSPPNSKTLTLCVKAENERSPSSSVAVGSEEDGKEPKQEQDLSLEGESSKESEQRLMEDEELKMYMDKKMMEFDLGADEEFKEFMANPSTETAIKAEKKRVDRSLKQLDNSSSSDNPFQGFLNKLMRDQLLKRKESLEKAEENFKALDLDKVSAFLHSNFLTNSNVYNVIHFAIIIFNIKATSVCFLFYGS